MLFFLACARPPTPPPEPVTPAPTPVVEVVAPVATSPAHVVLLGDAGKGNDGQRSVAAAVAGWCAARPCDLVAYLGDNLYPDGAKTADDPIFAEKFELPWAPVNLPFYVALGNHDHYGDPDAEIAYAKTSTKWIQPARHYAFSKGLADFFVVDTGKGEDGEIPPEQLGWLASGLAASTAAWRVVYGHHPIHSSGLHGTAKLMVETVEPVLQAGKADFYLCGHDHDLEVIDSEKRPVEIVSGGGASTREVNPPVAGSVYLASSVGFGYLVLGAESATLTMVEVSASGSKAAFERTWTR